MSVLLSFRLLRTSLSNFINSPVSLGLQTLRNGHTSKDFSDSAPDVAEMLPKELEVLKPLGRLYLNQVKVLSKRMNQMPMGQCTKTVAFDVENKANDILFKIEFSRGDLAQEYLINLYGLGDDKPLLAEMDLERSLVYRSFVLRVRSPPGNLISSVFELPGVSRVAIVEDEKSNTILQILTNGGFGWATSALILSRSGDRRLGRMYTMKSKSSDAFPNALHTTIHFPKNMEVSQKVTLIGTCLTFMGRYHL